MQKEYTEIELAALTSKGDKNACKELYMRYAARLYALCCRYSDDDEDARDLMHDAMIKAMGSLDRFKYRGEGSLYAWLKRMAINMAIDRMRKSKLRRISIDDAPEADIPEPTEEEALKLPREVMLGMISRLSDERRTVFNLYCIEGCSHKEIAELLGISEKGSASVLAKARNQLKKEITEYVTRHE